MTARGRRAVDNSRASTTPLRKGIPPCPPCASNSWKAAPSNRRRALVEALTRAVVETLGTKPEAVDILMYDIKRHDWATGGQLWSERS